jgi:alpha/beta superfamily hydrolase
VVDPQLRADSQVVALEVVPERRRSRAAGVAVQTPPHPGHEGDDGAGVAEVVAVAGIAEVRNALAAGSSRKA